MSRKLALPTASADQQTIDIRPASSVYATYQRLSYKPWYALAEFVDNSTASYYSNRKALVAAHKAHHPKRSPSCRVEINYDQAARRLTVKDNAFGMELDDFKRAIMLDQPPANRSGRNEFGMGLKTAACWFGTRWTVETTQLNSAHLYRATIDVQELAVSRRESIKYSVKKADPASHGTTITIEDVQQPIIGRAHERAREQLRSIYRNDLRKGEIDICYQGEPLTYDEPELLVEQTPGGPKLWRQEITLDVPWERTGGSLRASGWVGIRKTMSRRDSGFVLMRRGRVIVGGPDQGYRPADVCSGPQTHEYGRLVGELELDQWPVNQAKDGFSWNDGLEDAFIETLAKTCAEVIRKARTHRLHEKPPAPSTNEMKAAAEPIRQVLQTEPFRRFAETELSSRSVTAVSEEQPAYQPTAEVRPSIGVPPAVGGNEVDDSPDSSAPAPHQGTDDPIEYRLDIGDDHWLLRLHWQESQSEHYWMSLSPPRAARDDEPDTTQVVDITLNMAHPFLAPYLQNRASLDILQRLVFGLALAETIVRSQAMGVRVDPGAIRTKMNEVLKHAAQAEGEG